MPEANSGAIGASHADTVIDATTAIVAGAERIARERRPPLIRRVRFQLGGAVLLGLVAPLVLRWPDRMLSPAFYADAVIFPSIVGALTAILIGYFLIRHFSPFSSMVSLGYVVPSLLTSFAAVSTVLFAFRIDYSRYVLGSAFLLAAAWLLFAYALRNRVQPPTLALVPGECPTDTSAIGRVKWVRLSSPFSAPPNVDALVADLRADHTPSWERFIAASVLAGIPVYDIRRIKEMLSGRVEVNTLSENDFGTVLPSATYHAIKRIIDILLSLIALPLFSAVIAVTAILVKLETPGPAFFVQPRMGLRGKVFQIYKIRSMRHGQQAGQHFTGEADPRITRIGRFIRKYRIDEFPQIFNVLKGDMSWIGPRPESIALAEWYAREVPLYMYRHSVRPGLTGWAQVCQGNVAEVDAASRKLQYDFYYAKYFSPALDLMIVFRTLKIMATGFGSR